MLEWKSWYNPDSGYFFQFSTNDLHSEKSLENLYMDEEEALKKGYYRIYVTKYEINIESYDIPNDREFNSTKFEIEKKVYKKFNGTRWQVLIKPGYFFFPNQSFLFADSIKSAEYRKK